MFGRGVAVALGVGDGCGLNGLRCLFGVPLGLGDAVPGGTVALGGGDPPIGTETGLPFLGGGVGLGGTLALGVAVGLDGMVVVGGAIAPDPDIGAEIGLLLSGGAVAIGAAVATGNAVAPGGTVALGGGVCPG